MRPDPRPLSLAVLGRGVIDPDVPVIHADDPGILRGMAAFETLHVYRGRAFAMTEHLDRLSQSAERLGLPMPDSDALERLAQQAIEAAGVPDCTLRLTLTGGREGGGPVVMAMTGTVPPELEAARAAGISVVALQLGTDPRAHGNAPWLLGGVKSTSYAVNMAARDEALRQGADDAIFVAADTTVLEGPTTNVWWRHGSSLFTPALDLGILAGVTRAWIIGLAQAAGYGLKEGWYPLAEMAGADEAFTSSSVREIMPVVRLDGEKVGDGRPGEAAVALQSALRRAAGA